MRKVCGMTVCLAAVVLAGSCFDFSLQQDIDYPAELFAGRLRHISGLNPRHPAEHLSFLVYKGDERQLIRFSLSFSTIEMLAESEPDGISPARWNVQSGKYLGDLRLKDLNRLKRAGSGLLIEVQEREENSHLLIWME